MPDIQILDQIDRVTDGLCPCGAPPAPGSAYCGDDCRPTHISGDTDTRMVGDLATPMRWRPDLVTEADNTNLRLVGDSTLLGSAIGYSGPLHAEVFERIGQPDETWHVRLSDGHRFVGVDLTYSGEWADPEEIPSDLYESFQDAFHRLDREFNNTRHLVADDDPFADVMPTIGPGFPWRRMCRTCNRHGQPMHGQRVVHSEHHDWLNDEVQTEMCQLCPHCYEPYPGPPLTPRTRYEQPFAAWNLALSAAINGSRYRQTRILGVLELRQSADPAEFIQRAWDRMEVDLLRRIEQPQPTTPGSASDLEITAADYLRRHMAAGHVHLTVHDPHSILRNINPV